MLDIEPFLSRELPPRGVMVSCAARFVEAEQIAVLVIKPGKTVANANNSAQNIHSIIGRFTAAGWGLHALKLVPGGPAATETVTAHYAQPFHDGIYPDVRPYLSQDEHHRLSAIWGQAAAEYPVYHPTRLVGQKLLDHSRIAALWHAGRGTDNALLDTGSPYGINTITKGRDPRYGKRRLLLVRDHPAGPFFIVNGFATELVVRFLRPEERIPVLLFAQQDAHHDLEHIRRHVIGETKPHDALPGSIRYDALHARAYNGRFPLNSREPVGVQNNLVHLSDSLSEARRELALWLPEIAWRPSPPGKPAP